MIVIDISLPRNCYLCKFNVLSREHGKRECFINGADVLVEKRPEDCPLKECRPVEQN